MAHFAAELRREGFEVDERNAETLAAGLQAHVEQFCPERVVASEPMSWATVDLFDRLGVEIVASGRFLCSHQEFAAWAEGRKQLRMEDFYRWQRSRLDVLVDHTPEGLAPVGGKWNHDADNRERPPTDGRGWPMAKTFELDEIDREVLARMPDNTFGSDPSGLWPVTREQALVRLANFVDAGLAGFGPHEDAMLAGEWKLAHSTLSSSMNLGLLHPSEVVAVVLAAHEDGDLPINSVEGFVRQVIGWREFVWGIYWLWMPGYGDSNELRADRPLPAAFTGDSGTEMRCVNEVLGHVEQRAYAHHIERLMVLGNLALTAGVDPRAMTEWMTGAFIDGAEWVMLPNVIGMALFADGGRMATKPYASGGAYIQRMSDFCRDCRFDPRKRTGPDACPYTSLYWDFLARNRKELAGNHRMSRQLAAMGKLSDLEAVRDRAAEVVIRLGAGTL